MERKQIIKPLYDPMIIPRVKQYLEENVHQTYVDVGVMARHLQEKYREYARRKSTPFRILVDQAYKTVLHSYGLDSNPSSEEEEEEDDNSDLEVMDDSQASRNTMNTMLTNLYANSKGNLTKEALQQNAGELVVDISSDESDSDGTSNKHSAESNLTDSVTKIPILRLSKDLTLTRKAGPGVQKEQTESMAVKNDIAKLPLDLHIKLAPPIKKRKVDGRVLETANNGTPLLRPSRENGAPVMVRSSRKREYPVAASAFTFRDIGGADKILKELCELLLHIKHPEVYQHIGLPPPRGFLLHGPPGSGKTLLAQAIAGQLKVPLIQVAATELIAGVSGESEERIRELFEQAASMAPCVLFIDEIDAISSNRLNAQKDMERRVVTQLLTSLDGLSKYYRGNEVVVIGATNRADAIDPALRRVGRFDQEICLGIPDREARCQILRVICTDLRLENLFDYDAIAVLTPGYVGADLLALATRAASIAVKRIFHEKEESALKRKVAKPSTNQPIPMINLTDDILMEIDSVLDTVEQDKQENEEKALESENKTDDAAKEVSAANEQVKEPETAVDAITEKKAEDESTNNNVPAENTNSEKDTNESENKDENSVKKEEKEEEDNKMEADNDISNEKEKQDNDESTEIEIVDTRETLGDALLRNTEIKNKLGLDVMFKWLSNAEPLMTSEELEDLCITMKDFKDATKVVQPSAKREGFITVPDVTWNDIGSLNNIRQELSLAILAPVKYPQRLKSLGLEAPSGVLLCGPPGCGKTLLAKAIANEAGINFISVKGPELLNMYVGESERAVRQCFQRARNSAPCVIFFDEFDALCPKRSDGSESSASARVVNQLLTEMDGVEERKGVFLMAATNRPDMIDPAVLRPGRLDKILYVGLPEEKDRLEILEAITKKGTKPTLDTDVDLVELSKQSESFTGADLAGLVRQAALQSLKESISHVDVSINNTNDINEDNIIKVNKNHFNLALQTLRPSISKEDKARYEKLRQKYAAVPEQ